MKYMIFRNPKCLNLCVAVLLVTSSAQVVADLPFSNEFGRGYEVISFDIICDSARYPITQHFEYKGGVYTEFTLFEGDKKTLFAAEPSKVEYPEKNNTFESGRSVAWREVVIGIRDGDYVLSDPEDDAIDLKTIVISTFHTPGINVWEEIMINRQEVYLTNDGYLSSAFKSEAEKDRCSMESLKVEQ